MATNCPGPKARAGAYCRRPRRALKRVVVEERKPPRAIRRQEERD